MLARDWFDKLRGDVLDVRRAMEDVERARAGCGPRGMAQEPSGRGAGKSGETAEDRLIDAEMRLEQAKSALQPSIDRACDVLYGRSGRGGAAVMPRRLGEAKADAVHGYYLQGMSWPEVAAELSVSGSRNATHWCRNAAREIFAIIDRMGSDALADS